VIQGIVLLGFIVFNATFNNISVISWRSVLLVEETGVPGSRKPMTCRKSLTNLSHNVVHLALSGIRTHNISGDRHRLHIPRQPLARDHIFFVLIYTGIMVKRDTLLLKF